MIVSKPDCKAFVESSLIFLSMVTVAFSNIRYFISDVKWRDVWLVIGCLEGDDDGGSSKDTKVSKQADFIKYKQGSIIEIWFDDDDDDDEKLKRCICSAFFHSCLDSRRSSKSQRNRKTCTNTIPLILKESLVDDFWQNKTGSIKFCIKSDDKVRN